MNTLVKVIVALILVYGFVSSVFYINENGFTAATGFFIAPFVRSDNTGSQGFYKSSLALDMEKCKDKCYKDDTACQGNQEISCADRNGDDCTEWSSAYPCIGNEICGISKCGDLTETVQLKQEIRNIGDSITKVMPLARCINECTPGDRTTIMDK